MSQIELPQVQIPFNLIPSMDKWIKKRNDWLSKAFNKNIVVHYSIMHEDKMYVEAFPLKFDKETGIVTFEYDHIDKTGMVQQTWPEPLPVPDLLIVIFINMHNIPAKDRYNIMEDIQKRVGLGSGIGNSEKINIMMIPSDRDEVKVIPIKCYLDGIVAETPDNIESLVEELRELIAKAKDD